MPSKRKQRAEGRPAVNTSAPFGALPPQKGGPQVRNRRILRVLWWTLPLAILVALSGIAVLLLQFFSWQAYRTATDGNNASASRSYERQLSLTQWSPVNWVAHFNLGTTLLSEGDVPGAISQLEAAHASVPRARPNDEGLLEPFTYECNVRINLAVAWETSGDQQKSQGDLPGAIESYDQGIAWSELCEMPESSQSNQGDEGEDQQDQQDQGEGEPEDGDDLGSSTTERLEDKRDQAERELNGEPEPQDGDTDDDGDQDDGDNSDSPPPESPNGFEGETQEQREQREELQGKNADQQQREREEQERANRRPGSKNW